MFEAKEGSALGDEEALLLHERLLIVGLQDRGCRSGGAVPKVGLAGAILLDLQLGYGASVSGEQIMPAKARPRSGVLADAAAVIACEPRRRSATWWVKRLPGRMEPFLPRLADRLAKAGVLAAEQRKAFGLFQRTRWLVTDQILRKEVRRRLRAILTEDRVPTPDDAALAALVGALGLVGSVVGRGERRAAQRRAASLGITDPVIQAVHRVIKADRAASTTVPIVVSAG